MAEARIGGEGRVLLRIGSRIVRLHRFARLAVPGLEVLPDFRVRDLLEALRRGTGVREERREFEEREAVRGEHIEAFRRSSSVRAPKWSSPQRCRSTSANSAMRTKSGSGILERIETRRTIPGRRAR